MTTDCRSWVPGSTPVAVVMISLNEEHNMEAVLENLKDWAQEVFLVDSFSSDATVDIALRHGVHVVQRPFKGFGDQWNFAINDLPIKATWTMKLDPDERLSEDLKANISAAVAEDDADGFSFNRRLWFMGKPLPIRQEVLRVWKTGRCRFTDVAVNEHPLVQGSVRHIPGDMEHFDSPDLQHWIEKQNTYTSAEAIARFRCAGYAVDPKLFGARLERRMWFKKNFFLIPFRYQVLLLVNILRVKPWVSGYAGVAWARLRVWVRRMIEDKLLEMRATGKEIKMPKSNLGSPHPDVEQFN